MKYITQYEMCALIFLLVLTIRFFNMRKFQNKTNRIFGVILGCGIADIILDIIGSYFVANANSIDLWLNYTVNTVFYILQIAVTAILLLYVLMLAGRSINLKTVFLFIPSFAAECVILTNSFTHLIFYYKQTSEGLVFEHGSLFIFFYLIGALNILISFAVAITYRHSFRKIEIRTIVLFVFIILAAMVLQYFFPQVLLSGMAMAIAIFLMFLTIQNPETMLDSTTGTFNYSAFIDYLRKKISEEKAIWIIALDVGGIRRINSTMGIRTGNELLEHIGGYINNTCKNHATAFRMMGTRFIVVSDSYSAHNDIVKNITERFKKPWASCESEFMLMATVRYCGQKNKFSSPEDVVSLIDLAYAKAAEEGFGTTKLIEFEQLEKFRRNNQIKEALSRAITTGEGFVLNYQPIYSAESKKFCAAEALLRFNDPDLGNVSPSEFIPIAENCELIHQIDSLVVKKACDFLRSHTELFDAGLKMLEINLSATEFNHNTEAIFSDITKSIDTIENKICFEVTETALTSRREILSDFMNQLIGKGVCFAIDDFGTGYANIIQLAKLPFSIVKLDKTFVTQNNQKEESMLRDLVNMFNDIGLKTVLEGVETDEQAKHASDMGVAHIQGYYYSHPLSESDFVKLMTAQNNS